jgi:hypothetical protein
MPSWGWILSGIGILLILLIAVGWRPLFAVLREIRTERAREQFRMQRERLEARFLDLAAKSGKPRGLRWVDAEWQDAVSFVRDRHSGQIAALVGITVSFEAIPGGAMEDNPNVSNLRDATALFNYVRGTWITEGRALFNMSPDGAIDRYHDQYEPVPAPETER